MLGGTAICRFAPAVLAKRIIPCLDVTDGRVVKGVNFVDLIDAGDPVEAAMAYNAQEADELVFLDITASSDNRKTMVDVVRRTAEHCFIPLTVGGGIRTVENMREMLLAGADKVGINTSAVNNPGLVDEGAKAFGSQCIVVAIDAKREGPGKWGVYTHGGRTPVGLDVVEWAKEVWRRGAGEILLTSMDADGTQAGYDIELTAAVSTRRRHSRHRQRRRGQPRSHGGRAGPRKSRCGACRQHFPLRQTHRRRGETPLRQQGRARQASGEGNLKRGLMKVACLVFVNGIVLINLIGGLRQAWKLCRNNPCHGVLGVLLHVTHRETVSHRVPARRSCL